MGLGEGERNNIGVPDEWFVEYVEERRRNPGDDVLTQLARATFPDGSRPDALAVARVATLLFAAGQGTTVDLLSSALLMLAEQPDLQQLLRDERERIPTFIAARRCRRRRLLAPVARRAAKLAEARAPTHSRASSRRLRPTFTRRAR
jgi:cytochrome P450